MLEQNSKKSPDQQFKKSFGLSFAVHIFIFSLFFIKMTFFSDPLLDLSQSINISVGEFQETQKLPAKQIEAPSEPEPEETEEPPSAAPVEKAKPVTTPPPPAKTKEPKEKPKTEDVDLNKSKAKQKEALNKLKKLSALEKIKQDIKNESVAKIKSGTKNSKPRILPAGSALGGLDKLQADNYLQVVDRSIKDQWSLPQWLINKPLKAKILVKFNIQGQIISKQVVSSSANPSYDQYCLSAIEKAAPFPQVPEKLSEKFSIDGIIVGFPE